MEIRAGGGGGSLALEIRVGGGGVTVIQEIWAGGGGGGSKTLPSVGGVWIFSGITHWST